MMTRRPIIGLNSLLAIVMFSLILMALPCRSAIAQTNLSMMCNNTSCAGTIWLIPGIGSGAGSYRISCLLYLHPGQQTYGSISGKNSLLGGILGTIYIPVSDSAGYYRILNQDVFFKPGYYIYFLKFDFAPIVNFQPSANCSAMGY
jgi:hypothetical protein